MTLNLYLVSDDEALVVEFLGMWSTHKGPSLPDQLWPAVVAPDGVLFMGQIELFDILTCVKTNDLC